MISRRTILERGAAVSALGTAAWRSAFATPTASTSPAPTSSTTASIALVVVDERFGAAHALAGSLAAASVPRVVLPRDVLELWHPRLARICRSGTQSIAGVTTERGFFLLQTLAADSGMHVLSRVGHGALVSWVIGPKQV